MLPESRDYKSLRDGFRWQIPARYNIGFDCCDKWAAREPDRTALLIRSQTLSIPQRPNHQRARVLGAGRGHQMVRHILPNVMPMVFANTTLCVAVAILSETTLSFLGLGDPTRVSWGLMLENAFSVGAMTTGAWWFIIPPGVCVVLVVLSFTLVGQALEEIFNPRLRARR